MKPVYGADSALREAIRSHTVLEGEYEFLCGVRPGDPAAAVIAEFPSVRIVECATITPNGKVGSLIDLARATRYPILVVNDADIRVEPDYLTRVTAPLTNPSSQSAGPAVPGGACKQARCVLDKSSIQRGVNFRSSRRSSGGCCGEAHPCDFVGLEGGGR